MWQITIFFEECYIGLGKGSSIAARLQNNPNSISGFNPTSRRKRESIQTCLFSNPLEFEGVKIGSQTSDKQRKFEISSKVTQKVCNKRRILED